MQNKLLIGFIGQGFIGKSYADDFENRGYDIIRYDIEKYKYNKDKINTCDIVFIAVPTPTTPQGFNFDVLKEVLSLVGQGKIAVIKSTIQIGVGRKLQEMYPNITVMHSPEFLTAKTASRDAQNPKRNIIGITDPDNPQLQTRAKLVMSTLPPAPYELITRVENAEMIKYGGNCWFYFKVIFMNILFDLAQKYNLDYETIKDGMQHDVRIGSTHLEVSHQGGRGAGGFCFIKDFESFIEMLDKQGLAEQKKICENIRNLNLKYLRDSGKDQDLVKGVYGK